MKKRQTRRHTAERDGLVEEILGESQRTVAAELDESIGFVEIGFGKLVVDGESGLTVSHSFDETSELRQRQRTVRVERGLDDAKPHSRVNGETRCHRPTTRDNATGDQRHNTETATTRRSEICRVTCDASSPMASE